jgi:ankyrin repeat protein
MIQPKRENVMQDGPHLEQELVQLMQALRIREPNRAKALITEHPTLAQQTFGQGGLSPLLAAACDPGQGPGEGCDPTLFAELVKATKDVNKRNTKGRAVIHLLAQHNRNELLNILLSTKEGEVALNSQTPEHETPAWIASVKGEASVLYTLIQAGADIRIAKEGVTPLHAACQQGHALCVRLLLLAGASVNAEDAEKRTPAHYVASSTAPQDVKDEILSLLNEHGADLKVKSVKGNEPWEMAANYTFAQFSQMMKSLRVPSLFQLCLQAQIGSEIPQEQPLGEILPLEVFEKLVKVKNCARA